MVEPTIVIGSVTLVFTLYIAYKSKSSSVESERERQRFLTERCSGQKAIGEPTVIRIESIDFEGKRRGLRGWLSEEYRGDTVVTMSFMNVFIHPNFLSQLGQNPMEFGNVEAKEIGSKVVGDTTITNWRLETNDPDEILEFVSRFATAIDSSLKEGKEYVRLTKKVNMT